jgi:hypothetical protein
MWLESIDSRVVLRAHGAERAHFLLEQLIDHVRRSGHYLPFGPNTAYLNTIPTGQEPSTRATARSRSARGLHPLERDGHGGAGQPQEFRVRRPHRQLRLVATLYEVGFNHFWRAPTEEHGGDLVFIQGHSSPGIYARAYLEGRLSEEQLKRLPPGSRRRRAVLLSAPVADARLLAVPDRVDGPRPDHGDLPGAVHAYLEHRGLHRLGTARSGPSWATARWTSRSRWARSDCRCARSSTTWCSWSTATCSASTARCAATARSSRSWRRPSAAPAGT